MHAFIDGSESYRSGREQVWLNLPWLVIRIYIYMNIWRIRIYYIIIFIYICHQRVCPCRVANCPLIHGWAMVFTDSCGLEIWHTFEYVHAHRGALAQESGKLVRHQEPLSNAGFTKTSPGLLFVLCLAMAQGTASPWGGLHDVARDCAQLSEYHERLRSLRTQVRRPSQVKLGVSLG